MSFPSSRTAAVETLVPPPPNGKRKHSRPYQDPDRSWLPLPNEHPPAATRRYACFQTFHERIQRATLHAQNDLLAPAAQKVRSVIDLASGSTGTSVSRHGIQMVLVPQRWALDALTQPLSGVTLARIPPSPSATSAPGGGGVARASVMASVGAQFLDAAPESHRATDDDLAKALGAGDLSVLRDVLRPSHGTQDVVPIILTCTSLTQAVVDVVVSVQEGLDRGSDDPPTPLILLAVCPTQGHWLTSPWELRAKAKGVHFLSLASVRQEINLLLSFLLGLERPKTALPSNVQDPRQTKHARQSHNGRKSHHGVDPGTFADEDVRVPLSFPAIQLVQAFAQLAPPGQALPRAAAALGLILQHHYTTEPLVIALPPEGTEAEQGT